MFALFSISGCYKGAVNWLQQTMFSMEDRNLCLIAGPWDATVPWIKPRSLIDFNIILLLPLLVNVCNYRCAPKDHSGCYKAPSWSPSPIVAAVTSEPLKPMWYSSVIIKFATTWIFFFSFLNRQPNTREKCLWGLSDFVACYH